MNTGRLLRILVGAIALGPAAHLDAQQTVDSSETQLNRPPPADVQRLALVIGAQHYLHLDPVPNALSDASEITSSLQQIGFTFVRTLLEATEDDIWTGIQELRLVAGDERKPAMIVVYFAGHGFQRGNNYIVPTDARAEYLQHDSVVVSEIIRRLTYKRVGISVFFVDACRSFYPASSLPAVVTTQDRSPSDSAQPPSAANAIVGLATQSGYPAQSYAFAGALHSPYAQALVNNLKRSTFSVESLLGKLKTDVENFTGEEQHPDRVGGGIGINLYFVRSTQDRNDERVAWERARSNGTTACIGQFMKFYPDSNYLSMALDQYDQLTTTDPGQRSHTCDLIL
jgi:hypothetical protein